MLKFKIPKLLTSRKLHKLVRICNPDDDYKTACGGFAGNHS